MAGAEIVQDAVGFFQAFEGMEDGFRTRASAVHELLADPATAYVLVTSARPDAVAEATFFAEKLAERERRRGRLVVNRLAPSFGDGRDPAPAAAVRSAPDALEALEDNLAALNAVAAREERPSRAWPPRWRRPRSAASRSSGRTCTSWPG